MKNLSGNPIGWYDKNEDVEVMEEPKEKEKTREIKDIRPLIKSLSEIEKELDEIYKTDSFKEYYDGLIAIKNVIRELSSKN